jgi:hypothetical protein
VFVPIILPPSSHSKKKYIKLTATFSGRAVDKFAQCHRPLTRARQLNLQIITKISNLDRNLLLIHYIFVIIWTFICRIMHNGTNDSIVVQ